MQYSIGIDNKVLVRENNIAVLAAFALMLQLYNAFSGWAI